MNIGLKIPAAIIGIVVATLLVSTAMASPQITDTPLYTYRMEQESSRMNFLATERNTFSYTAESGYELNYDTIGGWVFIRRIEIVSCGGYVCFFAVACTYEGGTCYYLLTCNTCNPPTCSPTTCPK